MFGFIEGYANSWRGPPEVITFPESAIPIERQYLRDALVGRSRNNEGYEDYETPSNQPQVYKFGPSANTSSSRLPVKFTPAEAVIVPLLDNNFLFPALLRGASSSFSLI